MDGLGGMLALVIYRQRVRETEALARLSWDREGGAAGETGRTYLADLWGSIASNARRFSRDAGRLVGRDIRHERGNRATA